MTKGNGMRQVDAHQMSLKIPVQSEWKEWNESKREKKIWEKQEKIY